MVLRNDCSDLPAVTLMFEFGKGSLGRGCLSVLYLAGFLHLRASGVLRSPLTDFHFLGSPGCPCGRF